MLHRNHWISNGEFQCWPMRHWRKDILYFAKMNCTRRFPLLAKPVLEQNHLLFHQNKLQTAILSVSQTGAGAAAFFISHQVLATAICFAMGVAQCQAAGESGAAWPAAVGRCRVCIARRRVPQSLANTNTFATCFTFSAAGPRLKLQHEFCKNLQSCP